ncbi:MAG: OmpA family protein [Halioglobus sp.]
MLKPAITKFIAPVALAILAGCASTPPYTPTSVQPTAIDVTAFAPKVESFVVILDTSSSMEDEYQDRQKMHIAQDLVASFNSTVPPLGYQAGLVTFGKGSESCSGSGDATVISGLAPYKASDFAASLQSIACAGGTTPMADGIDAATALLAAETGSVAVFLVSDFWSIQSKPVEQAVSRLKAQHGDNLCLHTVKVGDYTRADSMIAGMTNAAGCDSAVNASDIGTSDAMANFVTSALLAPLEYEKHTVSATALFDFDKAIVKEQGKAELSNLGELIKSKGITVADIDVIGHTDNIGSEDYNQELSERRAMAVKDYLVSEGVDGSIIDASGNGEDDPVASNDTDEGRALNRRVDIHVGATRLKSSQ